MRKDGHLQIRVGARERALLKILKKAKVAATNTDLVVKGWESLCRENKLAVPA